MERVLERFRTTLRGLTFPGRGTGGAPAPFRHAHETPAGVRIYATGDIHGRADLLKKRFAAIDADLAERPIERAVEVYLGDYVDRGPDSRGVLDRLVARTSDREVVALMGNHEEILLRFLGSGDNLALWARLGGIETLASYHVDAPDAADEASATLLAARLRLAMPQDHGAFLAGLRPSFRCGDYFFAHAGVRPGIPLERQRTDDLLWIRDAFLHSDADFGAFVVHGHTPTQVPELRPNRINIDTLAYQTGRLTSVVLEADTVALLV